ncbi:pirin family protein [Nakamurella endophytica]|uniref:Pirin family protein n=1 Tax=Nakamurella endophytica TaxID=1748367 RepID=A0A917T387_9ACTN|nr:pirin family protein [Nakamurella endophytica]GGM07635.1 hypothetical protein GCM10011594_29470 [Nakamurella endophytica]
MSDLDVAPQELRAPAVRPAAGVRVWPGRDVPLGGVRGLEVTRLLPQRGLPTVGPWCFLDLMGPTDRPADILPHPHTGLQTVTWPLSGQIRHRDTLGSDVVVRPGELDIMTAGHGIAHSEMSVPTTAPTHLAQLWIALPDGVRDGARRFEQHRELPHLAVDGVDVTVVVGALAGVRSPAWVAGPVVGADLRWPATGRTVELPVDPTHEHAVVPLSGPVEVDGVPVPGGSLGHLPTGTSRLRLTAGPGARVLLLGGPPFREDLVMWWNFVARSHDEVVAARAEWEAGSERFGHIPAHGALRIPAPPLPGVRLRPRRRDLP